MKLPEQVRTWYDGLAPRERRLVVLIAVVVAALIVYLAIVQPVVSAHDRLANDVRSNRALLAWLDQATAQIQAAGPAAGSSGHLAPGQSVFAAVSDAAQNGPISSSVQRIEQSADGGVRLTLSAASFDSLIGWLGGLHQRDGIVVVQASIQQAETPNTVNATLTLNTGP